MEDCMEKSAKLLIVSFTLIILISSNDTLGWAKDSIAVEREAQKQESKVMLLQNKIDQEKTKANIAIDEGKRDTAAKHAKRAAKTVKLAKKRQKIADKLNKKAEKMERKENR
jgi:hypothetical protein